MSYATRKEDDIMSNIRKFFLDDEHVIINLSTSLCTSSEQVLESEGFRHFLEWFLCRIDKESQNELFAVKEILSDIDELIEIYQLLLVFSYQKVLDLRGDECKLLSCQHDFLVFTEVLYDAWRKLERYGIIQRRLSSIRSDSEMLIDAVEDFSAVILKTYRLLVQRINETNLRVFRQTPAGVDAGMVIAKRNKKLPKRYKLLDSIDFVETQILRTPFIAHSKANTRQGIFKETHAFALDESPLTQRHFVCFPIKIGLSLAFVYVHRAFYHHGVSLANLFEPATKDEYLNEKPDLIYVYGDTLKQYDCTYYHDEKNAIYFGYVNRDRKNDYFGYMKKMLLTLHNVSMIDKGHLPIHGAMVKIILKNNDEKNIVIIGDSGAGKSESLEAMRDIAEGRIKQMKTIFDDMGTFYLEEDTVVATGTETGAFIRLDDLENDYVYKELDRSIFLNPDRANARLVLPVATYPFIITKHHVDMVLYANNYEDNEPSIEYFDDMEEAKKIFISGKRKAKGTTAEKGLVESFFANPFGPVQRPKETGVIIDKVFKALYDTKIPVGMIYTKLAIRGKEHTGTKKAAKALLESLN